MLTTMNYNFVNICHKDNNLIAVFFCFQQLEKHKKRMVYFRNICHYFNVISLNDYQQCYVHELNSQKCKILLMKKKNTQHFFCFNDKLETLSIAILCNKTEAFCLYKLLFQNLNFHMKRIVDIIDQRYPSIETDYSQHIFSEFMLNEYKRMQDVSATHVSVYDLYNKLNIINVIIFYVKSLKR